MNATVKVQLLGRDYLLRSQGDPDRVQEAAALVEDKLAGLTGVVSVDTRDRFVLAMLNLAGEFLQEKRRRQAVENELDELRVTQSRLLAEESRSQRIEAELIKRIENALND